MVAETARNLDRLIKGRTAYYIKDHSELPVKWLPSRFWFCPWQPPGRLWLQCRWPTDPFASANVEWVPGQDFRRRPSAGVRPSVSQCMMPAIAPWRLLERVGMMVHSANSGVSVR